MNALKETAALGRHGGERSRHQNCTAEGRTVPMHTFESAFSKRPMVSAYCTLADIATALHNVKKVRCKSDAPLITFNQYRQGAQSRGIADIVHAHAVCGDIDHGFDQAIFDAALKELVGMGASVIAYQTYSHTLQAPRWRVFAFLDDPASPREYPLCWAGLDDIFGGMLDPAAKDTSRLNFWPSCPHIESREVRTFNMWAGAQFPLQGIKKDLLNRGQARGLRQHALASTELPFYAPDYLRRPFSADETTRNILGLPEETPYNVALVRSYLAVLDANCFRPEWLRVLFSLAAHMWACGKDLCREWSITGKSYNERDFDVAWHSCDLAKASHTTLRTMALDRGWRQIEVTPSSSDLVDNLDSNVAPYQLPRNQDVLKTNGWQPSKEFRLLSRNDLHLRPPLRWIIKGVLPERGLAGLYGPSTSGKSFLAFAMACAIAEGAPWFGHRVIAAPVVYVALEGEGGFKTRSQAWEQHHSRRQPANFFMVLQPFSLIDEVDQLARVIPLGAVVIIDTLNRAAPTADENSSKDMGEILEGAKQLQALTDGLVVVVHHTGKDATKGLRGHSSLFAALDSAIEVSRDDQYREWRVAKSKDGADGATHPFRLELKSLGQDEYGDGITSCVVVPDTTGGEIRRAKVPQGGNQRVVYDALREVLKAAIPNDPDAPACVPAAHPAVELEAVLPRLADRLTCEKRRRTTSARAALTGLVSRGVILFEEDWLWIP